MNRTRAAAFTALALASAMVVAACGSTDQSNPNSTGPSTGTTSAAGVNSSTAAVTTSGSAAVSGSSSSAVPSAVAAGNACGAAHPAYPEPKSQGGSVKVSLNEGLTSWNSNSSHGNAAYNVYPTYLTMALGGYYDSNLKYWDNTSFLTCKQISKDPVTVEYTINKDAKWSDGVPVSGADMLLFWAAQSGYYNTGEAQYDKDGNLVETADIAFDASSDAMHSIHHFPKLSADGKSMTVTYDDFYVDWQLNAPTSGDVPAHVVAMKALGETDPAKASKDLVTALQSFNAKATTKKLKDGTEVADTSSVDPAVVSSIKKISDFWNTGFDFTQLPSDPSLYLSDGAYKMTAFKKDAYMTFEANPDYTWGPKPAIKEITYEIIGDAMASVQAMQNGEVDVINPQATSDVLGAVQALANQGITTQTGDGGTYEHVDLAMNNKGPFDPAAYGGGAAGAK
ncbi:MAG: ABC transporter substrate-binding protein, partial [Nakamurella sp.]